MSLAPSKTRLRDLAEPLSPAWYLNTKKLKMYERPRIFGKKTPHLGIAVLVEESKNVYFSLEKIKIRKNVGKISITSWVPKSGKRKAHLSGLQIRSN